MRKHFGVNRYTQAATADTFGAASRSPEGSATTSGNANPKPVRKRPNPIRDN